MKARQARKKVRDFENRTIGIIAPDGAAIEVDVFMKPALLHLWSRGVVTLDCCAGHFPDYSAYIRIERNADFEQYAVRGQWETRTAPIMEFNPLFDGRVIKTEKRKDGIHHYYSKTDQPMFIDTGRTAFLVFACHDRYGQSRKIRGHYLKWLLGY